MSTASAEMEPKQASSSSSAEDPISSSSPRHDTLEPSSSIDSSTAAKPSFSTTPGTSFIFVVNSQASQPGASFAGFDSSGNPDRFAHTRTKRKRTSPEDFAILEREYEKEPRPDRITRADIASKVALNEKEVQIWFQNRRQMTRRKARTWQPNEISNIIHSVHHTGSASPEQQEAMSSQELRSSQSSMSDKSEDHTNERPGSGLFANASIVSFENTSPAADRVGVVKHEAAQGLGCAASPENPAKSVDDSNATAEDTQPEIPIVHIEDSPTSTDPLAAEKAPQMSKKPPNKPRLRMSLEGKAEIVIDKNTPSPPSKSSRRESWPARGPLQRSQSAVNPSTSSLSLDQVATDAPSSSQPSQLWNRPRPMGHSRDARAWEFYCDSDTRDALTIAAEHDRKGNAQGALSLLRSNSGSAKHKLPGSPLMPSLRKQNSNLKQGVDASKAKTGAKRKSLDDMSNERPKLARTSSSVARLQTDYSVAGKTPKGAALRSVGKTKKKPTSKKGDLEIWEDADADSDKENWEPGTRVSAPVYPRRQYAGASKRPALGTNLREISHESSIGTLLGTTDMSNTRRKQRMPQAPRTRPNSAGRDDEVATFMGENNSVSEGEDMDAVQNLLNLSRSGRW